MRHIAIIGSGPAGYYTAEAAQKAFGDDVRVDVFDSLPVPFGLIRSGVAPDHQSIKAVAQRYERTALSDNVRFVGNVAIGHDVTIDVGRGLRLDQGRSDASECDVELKPVPWNDLAAELGVGDAAQRDGGRSRRVDSIEHQHRRGLRQRLDHEHARHQR